MGINGVPTWNFLSRFQGKEWIRSTEHGYSLLQLLNFKAVPIEAVDASDCAINYEGLDNLCEWGGWGRGGPGSAFSLSWWTPEGFSVPSALSLLQWP